MIGEAEKVNHRTIMKFLNAPLMASFGGTKETTVKFINNWYHNGKFYFDIPVEISAETNYRLTGLSKKCDPVLVGIKEGLFERLRGTPTQKKLKRVDNRASPSHHTQNSGKNHIHRFDCHRTRL